MNRQQIEEHLGIAKPAKVRQSYPMINQETPSHWRKTLKLWAIVVLIVVLASMAMGFIVGVVA